jgi:citrate lyase subunit beta / citryl-CoA lyase
LIRANDKGTPLRIRSLLYVPVSSERFLAKAHERDADAIILDLEDAVVPAQKDAARARLGEAVAMARRGGAVIFVRINSEPARIRLDAEAACRAGADGLLVPKAREARAIAALGDFLEGIEKAIGRKTMSLVPMIEDPGAVLDARTIAAASPRVFALVAGGEDLATALGAEPTPEVLQFPKMMVHFAAKAAGVRSFGLLRTVADYNDPEGIEQSAREAGATASMAQAAYIRPWCRSSIAPSRHVRRNSTTHGHWLRHSIKPRPPATARLNFRAAWWTSPWCAGPARSSKRRSANPQ